MYTAEITSKKFDKVNSQLVIGVTFTDGTDTQTQSLRYGADFDFNAIKRNIKQRLDLLNAGESNAEAIATGVVDVASIVEDPRPQAEKDASDWLRDFNRLEKVQQLIDLGVLNGNEKPVTDLRTKVATDFKPVYINLF